MFNDELLKKIEDLEIKIKGGRSRPFTNIYGNKQTEFVTGLEVKHYKLEEYVLKLNLNSVNKTEVNLLRKEVQKLKAILNEVVDHVYKENNE